MIPVCVKSIYALKAKNFKQMARPHTNPEDSNELIHGNFSSADSVRLWITSSAEYITSNVDSACNYNVATFILMGNVSSKMDA